MTVMELGAKKQPKMSFPLWRFYTFLLLLTKSSCRCVRIKYFIWWSWGCHGTECTLIRFAGDTKLGVAVDRLKSGAAVRREPGPGTRPRLEECANRSHWKFNNCSWRLHSFDTIIIQGAKLRTGPCFPCAFVDLNLPGSHTFKWLGVLERWAVLWWCYPVPFFLQCSQH